MYNRQDIVFGIITTIVLIYSFSSTDFYESSTTNPSLVKCDHKKVKIKIILEFI